MKVENVVTTEESAVALSRVSLQDMLTKSCRVQKTHCSWYTKYHFKGF